MTANTGPRAQVNSSSLQRHPLIWFFVLAIGLTWIFMITDALGSHGILPFRLPLALMLLMGYMPTAAALIVEGVTKGRAGVRALLRRLLIARVGLVWYLIAIFGFAGVCAAAVLLHNAFNPGRAMPLLSHQIGLPAGFAAIPFVAVLFIFVGIINGEELGWRGFALPRLQARFNSLHSSLMLGVIWTIFHLPLFFTKTGSSQADMSFVSFLLGTVALSVLYTWIFNNTRGSVFLAYLFHASANTWTQVFSVDKGNPFIDWTMTALLVLLAVGVTLLAGAGNLSRSDERIQEG